MPLDVSNCIGMLSCQIFVEGVANTFSELDRDGILHPIQSGLMEILENIAKICLQIRSWGKIIKYKRKKNQKFQVPFRKEKCLRSIGQIVKYAQ